MITRLNPEPEVRAAIIKALKADAALKAIVPAARMYPPVTPATLTWPFIKMGVPITTPRWVDGANGATVSSAVHNFTKRSSAIPDPEQLASKINAHVMRVLDGLEVLIDDDQIKLTVTPRQAQVIRDGVDDGWHGYVTYAANAD